MLNAGFPKKKILNSVPFANSLLGSMATNTKQPSHKQDLKLAN